MLNKDKMANAAAILNNEKRPGDSKPSKFFRPEKGKTYTLRILPDKDGEPMRMFAQHYRIADKGFVCPKKTYENKKCPVCDHIISNWKSSTKEVQDKFKEISAKMRWYSVVFVRELNQVMIWSYSPTVAKQLVALFNDPEYDDISDLVKGCDIEMKQTQAPGKQFADTTIKPKRHASPIVGTAKDPKKLDEAAAEELMKTAPVIKDEMNFLTNTEIDEAFMAYSLKGPADAPTTDDDSGNGGSASAPDDDIPF